MIGARPLTFVSYVPVNDTAVIVMAQSAVYEAIPYLVRYSHGTCARSCMRYAICMASECERGRPEVLSPSSPHSSGTLIPSFEPLLS